MQLFTKKNKKKYVAALIGPGDTVQDNVNEMVVPQTTVEFKKLVLSARTLPK